MVRYTHPEMFYLLIPFVLVIIWYAISGRKLRKKMEALGTEEIRMFLLNRVKLSRVQLRSRLLILGILFIILASVGPQIGTKMTQLNRRGVDVIIALDTSTSMDAIDISPSRIEKAKHELSRFINGLDGDRVGIIVFAGSAHLHCPLTSDYSAARLFLNTIDSKIIATQGTDMAAVLELAMENISEEEETYKVIVLVSDGEDHQGRVMELAEDAKKRGVIVHTIGVGTAMGGPIPILDVSGKRKDFKKDRKGNIVTSKLNGATLSEIAFKTGGKYIRVENQSNAITPIIDEISEMENRELKSHVFSQYEDRFQVFLIISLILFLVEFFLSTRTKEEMMWEGRFTK
jgi:Ca-activated chloride channel family protein